MLFDLVPDTMFFIKDREARYILVNQAMVLRCGKRRTAEVLGRTAAELFPDAFGRNTTQLDLQVIAREETVQDKLELYHVPELHPQNPDQLPPRWCLTHKFPLRAAAGQTSGLVGISRDLPRPDERSAVYQQLARVVTHIAAHPEENLRIPELARLSGLSEDRLERGARQVFGLTPKQLVMKARLERASLLLRQTGLTVSAVAHQCGYADHSAFTRLFRGAVGLTPTQYREAQRER